MKEKHEKKATGAAPILPELVAKARAGDQAAFTELYERTSAMVYRTIRSMVQDEDLVWDIQQDSYLRAWRGLDKLGSPETFLPWLRRIAVNAAADALNKRAPLTFTDLAGEEDEAVPELPDLDPAGQPDLALDRKETARLVRELLGELSPEQQAVVGMYYYEDMPIKDIAALLRVSPSTVKNQLSRGRKRIETGVRALEKQGVKLYGLAPLPFLLALLGRLEPAAGAEKQVLNAVLAESPAAAGTSAVAVTAMTAGQVFLKNLGVALVAVAAAAAVIVGGKLGYDALKKETEPRIGDERPTAEETVNLAETGEPLEPVSSAELRDPAPIPENACGPDLTWRLDAVTGTLIIEGSGEMYDYTRMSENDCPPWESYCDSIHTLSLPEGLTSIGCCAFSYLGLTEVTIPEGVTVIGQEAFCPTALTSLTLPETLTVIGDGAFSGCSGLTSLTIPESVTSIGEQAFSGASLTSVTIPARVSSIAGGAFSMNAKFASFSVDPENQYFTADENGVLYSKDKSTLVACPGQKSGHFEIPEGVTSIGDSAFFYCSRLSSVTIPESVTAIGENAFSDCRNLTSVTIPSGLRSIEKGTFSYCTKLRSVTLPEGLTSIGDYAFLGSGLTDITLPEDLTSIGDNAFFGSGLTDLKLPQSLTYIGIDAFSNCAAIASYSVHPENPVYSSDENGALYNKDRTALIAYPRARSGAYEIPAGLSSIDDNAFLECTGLTAVTIPDTVTSIGRSAFHGCTGLTAVNIPDSVTAIGDSAFCRCTGLTALTLPDSVTTLEERAFEYTGLTSVMIPESVTTIGERAFSGCTDLTSVTIPEGVRTIGMYAFSECSALTSVEFPQSVTDIEEGAFSRCSELRSITIPDGVLTIGNNAFFLTGISYVNIPASVTSIANDAFEFCSALEAYSVDPANRYYASDGNGILYNKDKTELIACPVTKSGYLEIPASVLSIGNSAFFDCTELRSVTIPESVTYIDSSAFSCCEGLTEVTIPASVISIGESAFKCCTGLTSLTISEGVTAIGDEAFCACDGLSSVTIPRSIDYIGDCAFMYCSGLKAFSVHPENQFYSTDENGVLYNKDKTELIVFPKGIGGKYEIPASVTSIRTGAFADCSELTTLTIPESVTSIDFYAFDNFGGLTICGVPGSEAEQFAYENGIPFEAIP